MGKRSKKREGSEENRSGEIETKMKQEALDSAQHNIHTRMKRTSRFSVSSPYM
jgi:hypothetical protein